MKIVEVLTMNNRRILAINGSYRTGGITDQAVEEILDKAKDLGADVEQVQLRDYPIGFCVNCRECMQQPGAAPGKCVLNDGMTELIQKIEQADGYVLAAPTNYSAVTALFKRFMERLSPYGYWPWGTNTPTFRKAKGTKKPAIIISSCAAPALLGKLTYGTNQSLKVAAKTMGGKIVGKMITGMISQEAAQELPERARRRARALAPKLAA
jgi:multimeric flavodoxin WrbA